MLMTDDFFLEEKFPYLLPVLLRQNSSHWPRVKALFSKIGRAAWQVEEPRLNPRRITRDAEANARAHIVLSPSRVRDAVIARIFRRRAMSP